MSDSGRVAIYYAPHPDSALWQFGSTWLGRDALTGAEFPLEVDEATVRFPRHYGFHATLKPPFELREGVSFDDLLAAATSFASRRTPFALPALRLSRLGRFLAITDAQPCPLLRQLAADCVTHFEPMRRPLTSEQAAARRKGIQNPRQLAYIDTWGYPYVFDEWKFHMTLTSSLADELVLAATLDLLSHQIAPVLREPLICEAICLFVQCHRDDPFRILARVPFAS